MMFKVHYTDRKGNASLYVKADTPELARQAAKKFLAPNVKICKIKAKKAIDTEPQPA